MWPPSRATWRACAACSPPTTTPTCRTSQGGRRCTRRPTTGTATWRRRCWRRAPASTRAACTRTRRCTTQRSTATTRWCGCCYSAALTRRCATGEARPPWTWPSRTCARCCCRPARPQVGRTCCLHNSTDVPQA
ncbi:uncharacterized protein LOC124796133 [Schistocerca piceifrons]|uniref:uncharacterized protein LOC124796133 n=1 Tax=Schistocerca piceifrons TaxID=274613 RepID=UPI001F5EFDC8|nr:uncharacterized protein LOC124796133 [Schistocerca piceifrons]